MTVTEEASFGRLLRRFRREAELTQEDLAERAGLSVRGIGYLERETSHAPYQATVLQLAEALGLEPADRDALLAAARRQRTESMRLPALIPVTPTPLLGREREVDALTALLMQAGRRLVTLTGPGGVGKTRLAADVAVQLQERFASGAALVALASLADPELVLPTIAQALGVREAAGRSVAELLIGCIGDKAMLLLLDNLEHLLPAAPSLAHVLAACPQLRLLVTSRAALRVQGEQEYPVAPLVTPDPKYAPPVPALARYPAVELFVQRAQAVQPAFVLNEGNAITVAAICHRLDGLPLAIELAAARLKLFPPHDLLQRLDRPLAVLTGGPRDQPERLQTLRNTMDWSYSLLSAQEQTLFARLSVFAGGCTVEAAEAVCSADGELDLLSGLASLVEKSLVRQRGTEEARFDLLETIRQYAAEKLAGSGEADCVHRRHAEYCLFLVGEPDQVMSMNPMTRSRLEPDLDNLRAAMTWLMEHREPERATRLMCGLLGLWNFRGYWTEGRRWLRQGLTQQETLPRDLRAKAHDGAALLAFRQGDLDAAMEHATRQLALVEELGDAGGAVEAALNLGLIYYDQGDRERARILLEETVAQARELGLREELGDAMLNLAVLLLEQGHVARAENMFREVAEQRRSEADPGAGAWPLARLGSIALDRGDLDQAESTLREAVILARDHGHVVPLMGSLYSLAEVAVMAGDAERAARLYGAEEREGERLGRLSPPRLRETRQHFLDRGQESIGEHAWQRAWDEGRAMSLEEAIEYALDEAER